MLVSCRPPCHAQKYASNVSRSAAVAECDTGALVAGRIALFTHLLPLSKDGKCCCRHSPPSPSSQLPHAGRALALLQLWRSDIADDDDDGSAGQELFQVRRRIPCRLLVLTPVLSAAQLSSSHLHALLHFLLLAPQNRCLVVILTV
jgi:hypothetical protein